MPQKTLHTSRLRFVAYFFLILAILIIVRLFYLQIWQHNYYETIAAEKHDLNQKIFPRRGTVYFTDARTGELSTAAIDKDYYTIFADPTLINGADVNNVGDELSVLLNITDTEQKRALYDKLSRHNSRYQPLAHKVSQDLKNQIADLHIKGVYAQVEQYRFYPEENLAAAVLGFGAKEDDTKPIAGKYGIERYWNQILSGEAGEIQGETTAGGNWITLAGRTIVPAQDGADLTLTIDRNLEYRACNRLKQGFDDYKPKSASLVMMDPNTGAILAMCSFPDFDPNNYGNISSTAQFVNTSISTPYEPGSVFKPIVMSMALDMNALDQNTQIPADRLVKFIPTKGSKPIINAGGKPYHPPINTTDVLIHSINTGMTWVVDQIGFDAFGSYLQKLGFGEKTGITLSTESSGNIDNIIAPNKPPVNMYYSSFGQGITVTPLQLAMVYSALANGGKLLRPYIVNSVEYSPNKIQKTEPQVIGQPINPRTSALIGGMLVATMNSADYKNTHVPNYSVAAKTGTAQIFQGGNAKRDADGRELYNHTITGYGPYPNPRVVLVVHFEEPDPTKVYAEQTTGKVFRDIMQMALKYFNIPENK